MIAKKILAVSAAAAMLFSAAAMSVSANYEQTGNAGETPVSVYAEQSEMPESIYAEDISDVPENDYDIMHSGTYYEEINEEFFNDLILDTSYFSMDPDAKAYKNSYYDQLDEESKIAYETILEKFKDKYYTGTIIIPLTKKFTNNKKFGENAVNWVCSVLWPAVSALVYDHPERSWLRMISYSWSYDYFAVNSSTMKLYNLKLEFEGPDPGYGNYVDMASAVNNAVNDINKSRGKDKSVYNTLLQINNYLCRKISYNHTAADDNDHTYSDEQKEVYQTAYSAFNPCNGDTKIRTVCAGYARAFKVLCDVYEIPCIYIGGNSYPDGNFSRIEPHAWNYVKVGSEWWAVDVTWNDNDNNNSAPNNNYFLVAANDLPYKGAGMTFEQSHIAERLGTGLDNIFFQCPSLKGTGAKANLKSECAADSAAAKAAVGDGDVSKMGAGAGMSPVTYENGNIPITKMTFPDEEFRNWVSANIDKNKDGKLSYDERFTVVNMDISGCGIAFIKGIEYFKSLTQLKCSENIIVYLDLSKNTVLTSLDCSVNQLEELDISKNTALTALNCSVNGINSLDLSQNTALVNLSCSGNLLESLDISNNTALTALDCSGNSIGSLDVSSHTALESLDCSGNKLESLDILNNTALTSLNYAGNGIKNFSLNINTFTFPDDIFRAWVSENADSNKDGIILPDESNAVKSIDVSGLGIGNLDGIGFFPSLTNLDCSENKLVDLDISLNSELVRLDVTENALEIIDISQNAALRHLNTDVIYITGDDTDLISLNGVVFITPTAFPDKTFRTWINRIIDIDHDGELYPNEFNNIVSIDVSRFDIADLSGIECFPNITELDCSGNQLEELDVSKNTALTTLDCSGNKLTSLDISKNTALITLDCSVNQLTVLDISRNTALVNLDYTGNPITELITTVPETPPVTTAAPVTTTVTSAETQQETTAEVTTETPVITTVTEETTVTTIVPETTTVTEETTVTTIVPVTTTVPEETTVITTVQVTSAVSYTSSAAETTALTESITRPATETSSEAVTSETSAIFTVPATVPVTTTVYYEPAVTKVNAEVSNDLIAGVREGEELSVVQEGCTFVFDPVSVEKIKEVIGDKDISLDYSVVDKDKLFDEMTDEKVIENIRECDAVLSLDLSDTDGNKIEFSSEEGGSVDVTVPYEAPAGTETVEVYNVDPDGVMEKIDGAVYDPVSRTVTFSATHYPYYAVKAVGQNGESLIKPELPQTGNNAPANYMITVSALMLAVAGAFAMIRSGIAIKRKNLKIK